MEINIDDTGRVKMRYVVIIVVVLIVSMLALGNSCYPEPPDDNLPVPPVPVNNQKADTVEAEKIIKQLKVGEVFSLSLESNPSTGFDWTVKYDKTMIEYLGDTSSPQTEILKPGDQYYPAYTFKALKSGETTIMMIYEQSKESGFSQNFVLKSIEIEVTIKDLE